MRYDIGLNDPVTMLPSQCLGQLAGEHVRNGIYPIGFQGMCANENRALMAFGDAAQGVYLGGIDGLINQPGRKNSIP